MILYQSDRMPWFGGHSGYELLPRYMAHMTNVLEVTNRVGLVPRLIGGCIDTLLGRPRRGSMTTSEFEFMFRAQLGRSSFGHVLYGDNHLRLAHWGRSASIPIAFTLHHPISQWTDEMKTQGKSLSYVICPWSRGIDIFRELMPDTKFAFIRHGADIEFFKPAPQKREYAKKRIVYSGVFLRNTEMLAYVVNALCSKSKNILFDFIVPKHALENVHLQKLLRSDRIHWHIGISDLELLEIYQRATLCLLPLSDSGVNNSVLEAIACAIPLVTTDVGGIRDYGGGDAFPLIENDDVDGMIDAAMRLLEDEDYWQSVSDASRQFATSYLAWSCCARMHWEAYQSWNQ